ncbi:hypothetical protein [Mediterraneibacter gnavus]|uniref:hypothetical protein n=1 Tax=Mediterraneibacter gnavus TaxID=33038 RepID=UPI0034A46617
MLKKFTESMRERVQMFVAEMQAETGLSVVEMILILVGNFTPYLGGVYCVDRVEMCGQILLDIQRKVESVYEVKGKI